MLILSTNADQKSVETEFSIPIGAFIYVRTLCAREAKTGEPTGMPWLVPNFAARICKYPNLVKLLSIVYSDLYS